MRAFGLEARSRIGAKVALAVQTKPIAIRRFCPSGMARKIAAALARQLQGVERAGPWFLVHVKDDLDPLAARRPHPKMNPARRHCFRADRQPSLELRLSHLSNLLP